MSAPFGIAPITKLKAHRLRHRMLRAEMERAGYRKRWRDLNDFILPHKSRFVEDKRFNDAKPRQDAILDTTASLAIRTLRAGMMSGITSPARPWFRLSAPDPDMNDYGPVREWLYFVQRNMEWLFSNTNLYKILPSVYESLAVFGPAVVSMLKDTESILRFVEFPIGSYLLALGARGRIDTCYRDVPMTVKQMVEMFGLSAVSDKVRLQYEKHDLYSYHDVVHLIEPRDVAHRRYGSDLSKDKKFASCWYETDLVGEQYLRESGFDRFPLLTPRWDATEESPYGFSLGAEVLPDVRGLQTQQLQKLQGIEAMVKPATQGPSGLDAIDVLPGGHNVVPDSGGEGIRPLYEVRVPLGDLREDMELTRGRIRKGLFEDLFLMLANIDRAQITAYEVAERKEEKLLQLGPVLESINDDLLDPLIENTFAEMSERGMFPPPPEELLGSGKLRVEYISILHQAQRAVGVSAVDRLLTMVGGMAQFWPQALDKIDTDEVIDDVAERLGTPPKIVRGLDEVEEVRAAREQNERAMAAVAAAPQVGKTVKDLATSPVQSPDGGDTALSAALRSVGAA